MGVFLKMWPVGRAVRGAWDDVDWILPRERRWVVAGGGGLVLQPLKATTSTQTACAVAEDFAFPLIIALETP